MLEQRRYFGILSNFFVHLIVPLIAIFNFVYEGVFLKTKIKIKDNIYLFALKNLVFVIAYLFLALIIYFSLGYKEEDAVYNFLHLVKNPW